MNTPWLWLTVATGLAVRIGLPLLVLVTMVLVMRRLDKRWQSEAKRPAAPLTTAAEEPCWEASSCANPACNECVVHQHPETPCWQQFRDEHGNLREKCLACELFAAVPVPQPAREEHQV